jgi:hypothetical protein
MYLLRETIGGDAVNTALRRYHAKFSDPLPPYATSVDLIAELRAVTPDSLQYLITDLFETVTLWDVETERAVMEETATGEYRVTLDVVARKMRADSIGNETDVPMKDLVQIGIFAGGEGNAPGEPLHPEAAPHPQRQADDHGGRAAGAGARRHRSIPEADRPRTW